MYMAYLVVHFTMVHHILGISLVWYEIQTDNKNLLINNSYYGYRPYQNYSINRSNATNFRTPSSEVRPHNRSSFRDTIFLAELDIIIFRVLFFFCHSHPGLLERFVHNGRGLPVYPI